MVFFGVNLSDVGRIEPLPIVRGDGRGVLWVEIMGAADDLVLVGSSADLRYLAASATAAAERVDRLRADVHELLAARESTGQA
ncbi:hypothetical protein [Candidatus Solirubrobacter pratensis]|uniref:hypothetical protein n=1 Tax=Candidatus Solirubrobacter pratensis TaxID=1298857 RepID=UPI00040720E2|nr:hypothetical protein [Candidatus Solirubrobacter pratensis]